MEETQGIGSYRKNPPYAGQIRRLLNTWKYTNGTHSLILEISTQLSQASHGQVVQPGKRGV